MIDDELENSQKYNILNVYYIGNFLIYFFIEQFIQDEIFVLPDGNIACAGVTIIPRGDI